MTQQSPGHEPLPGSNQPSPYQGQAPGDTPPPYGQRPAGDASLHSDPNAGTGPAPARAWYKKKRFILPGAFLLFFIIVGAFGDGDAGEQKPAAAASPSAAAKEKTADEVAAEKKAEEKRQAQKAADGAAKAEEKRLEEEARVAAEAAAAEAAAAEAARAGTVSQQNAYRSALTYLDFSSFSRAGLIRQLTSEYADAFPREDAEFAIARLEAEGGVDWNEQAAKSAKTYMELMSYSRAGLIQQLTSEYGEGFTREQAEYGVSQTGL
ncbi:Ltp family lipoprotein [Cellulomonas chengniuliangii]|uniref:Ltp family lipoprotein n=1 Tax=Cellulomonas chengniuliangii TaxID=2968084 RepID=A0ABY5KUK0_9CELL|nr:Ltp family lipoprotein [Cellulomonas chengniuliangii]MCC2308525.1 Ltp family lipoprotein [Cellulomonas chengniuliangii]MCC2317542.1 Ltp family lipoprotein [Cellulomonas chengniuliangii]UUI73889.1 Ltp family lipoprotein [Cellulomonas chengniuliangii]